MLSVAIATKNNKSVQYCYKNACNSKQPQKKNNTSEQDSKCNPFQCCSLCCGYLISEFSFKKLVFCQLNSKKIIYIENKKSSFFASYFNPPEIIYYKFAKISIKIFHFNIYRK